MTKQSIYTTFRVTDFGTANALIALRYPLQSIEWRSPTRADFIFAWSEDLDRDVQRYTTGQLLVDASEMFNAGRTLKNKLHASRESQEHGAIAGTRP